MQRARQTVAPFASLGLPMHAHDQLREFHWGVYEGKPYNESLKLEVNDLVAAWERGETHLPISGGESPDQALARMLNAMDEIFATYPDGNLLICTHGRVLRILLAHWLAGGPDRMQQFPHYNTGLNILRHTPQGFVAERLCDISHLEGMEG
jgi:probable phosphoglycerate mutase